VQAADGQELFAGAPVTKTPSRAALLKRGAMIASATAEKQLRDEGRTTSANAVKLTTQAAQGAGVWTILRDLYGFLPTFGQIVTWVIPLLMLSVVAILVLLGVLASDPAASALFALATPGLGLLVGACGLIVAVVTIGRSRIQKAIDKALNRT
jgi:hypothetical protein